MPATAGRVRMPADNRLSVSDSLKSTEIWQKTVGYDPYAPTTAAADKNICAAVSEEKARGIMSLARLTGMTSGLTPGVCKQCGQVGHLTYQCRNHIILDLPKKEISKLSSKNSTEHESKDSKIKRASSKSKKRRHRSQERRSEHHRHHRHRSRSNSESSSKKRRHKTKRHRTSHH